MLLSLQFNPVSPIKEDDPMYERNPTLKDRIHCLVAFLPANTVSLMDDAIIGQMRVVREKARNLGESYNIYMFILKNVNFMHIGFIHKLSWASDNVCTFCNRSSRMWLMWSQYHIANVRKNSNVQKMLKNQRLCRIWRIWL